MICLCLQRCLDCLIECTCGACCQCCCPCCYVCILFGDLITLFLFFILIRITMLFLKFTLDERIAGDSFCLCSWDFGVSLAGGAVSLGFLVEIADFFPDCISITYGCCKICCNVCRRDKENAARQTASILMTDNRSGSVRSTSYGRSPSYGSPRGGTELVTYGQEAHATRKDTKQGMSIIMIIYLFSCSGGTRICNAFDCVHITLTYSYECVTCNVYVFVVVVAIYCVSIAYDDMEKVARA